MKQTREHAEIYLNKVTNKQSKYIALHVGIFWSIGRFIIKNQDMVKVMIDSESIFEHLSKNTESTDSFIQARTNFIKQLVKQRKLNLQYFLMDEKENQAAKLLLI